jgi:hypothetical protein
MNWIHHHAVAGRSEPIPKPESQSIITQNSSGLSATSWMSARVEMHRLRREFFRELVSRLKDTLA